MKRLALLLAAICGASALAGCVGYVPVPVGVGINATYSDGPPPPRVHRSRNRDRDRDGVPNRYDQRPGDPYRY